MEEGFTEPAGKYRLGEVSEILLHHIGHIKRRLPFVTHVVRVAFIHFSQRQNPGFNTGFSEQANLQVKENINDIERTHQESNL